MKKLTIPLAILISLIAANVMRFDTEATKAVPDSAIYYKWVRDRWTGDLWTLRYSPSGLSEEVSLPNPKITPLAPQSGWRDWQPSTNTDTNRIQTSFKKPSWETKAEDEANAAAIRRKQWYTDLWYVLTFGSSVWTLLAVRGCLKERKKKEGYL